MLVAEADALRVRHVVGGIERLLGVSDWEGRTLPPLLGDRLAGAIGALMSSAGCGGFMRPLTSAGGETLDVAAHLKLPHVIVAREAASTEGLPASHVMDRLATAATGFERAATAASRRCICSISATGASTRRPRSPSSSVARCGGRRARSDSDRAGRGPHPPALERLRQRCRQGFRPRVAVTVPVQASGIA